MAPESVQAPLPRLRTAVRFDALLLTIDPKIRAVPSVEPCSVSVLLPAPEAVTEPMKSKTPVPDWSSTAPPVVPERLMLRCVDWEEPVIVRLPVEAREPMSMVADAVSIGAPRELEASAFPEKPTGVPFRITWLPLSATNKALVSGSRTMPRGELKTALPPTPFAYPAVPAPFVVAALPPMVKMVPSGAMRRIEWPSPPS